MSSEIILEGRVYSECDEFVMTVGKTYLVHSDTMGYFLGKYDYASRTLGAFAFRECKFYERNYHGDLVLSKQLNQDVMISMVGILVRQ